MTDGHNAPASLHGTIGEQVQLSFKNAVEIAWKNIRVRLVRSLLVTSGIILALAFLTYVMCSDTLARSVSRSGDRQVVAQQLKAGLIKTPEEAQARIAFVEQLRIRNVLADLDDADARSQTRWLVGLALLVSFVGILNAMLLSVTERFKEIGTMKCLGALNGLIVELFLLESTFQGIVGTAIGICIGLALTLVEGTTRFGMTMWRGDVLPLLEMARLSGICLLAGTVLTIVGALYPAWRAAQMQPVDAMRSEI